MSQVIEVPLTQGKIALISEEDFDLIAGGKWSAEKCLNTWYARARINGKTVRMHRLILGFPDLDIDHKNGNGLDNTRSNLRLVTQKLNQANSRSVSGFSKYKGVSWHKNANKWRAYIAVNGKQKHLGLFLSEDSAAEAYNIAAISSWGEFARLNQIDKCEA